MRRLGRRWLAAPLALVLSSFALAVAATSAASESRAAIVLYDPPPVYPMAAAGSDISPEATVRVAVDAKGRVSRVEVVRIEPASRFDDIFRRALEQSLSQWRFAPRYEDGRPIPTELQWTTKFYAPGDGREPLLPDERWDWILGIRPRQESSYLELPHEQRVELLEQRVRAGVAAFAGRPAQQHASSWFVVRTSASPEVAATVAGNLEATYSVLHSMLGEHIPLQGERLKVQVFVYQDPQALARLQEACNPDEITTPGFYSQLGLIGMHLDLPTPDLAVSMLIHEGTHAFIDRHVVRPGVELPYWLSEGLAEYMSNSTIRKGRLIPGKVPRALRHDLRMIQGRLWIGRWTPDASLALTEIKQAARRGEALSLAQMLTANRAEFLGKEIHLYYGMSWMLVHYLRHGREEWAEREFPRLLLYIAEGYPVGAAFETVYGTRIASLEESFRRYIAGF